MLGFIIVYVMEHIVLTTCSFHDSILPTTAYCSFINNFYRLPLNLITPAVYR